MFIGHAAVGFAAKRVAPRASLGALMTAPYLLDLLWPIFVLAGWEEVRIDPGNTVVSPLDFVRYPISHSLVMAAVWGFLFGILYWSFTGYRRGAVVIALAVVSHWVLDAVVHRPDLPLIPGGGPRVGLGLWNSLAGALVVEGALFAVGLWSYLSQTNARGRAGVYGMWGFIGLLLVAYIGSLAGPPPPSARAIALTGIAFWIVPWWVAWFDRHRSVSNPPAIE